MKVKRETVERLERKKEGEEEKDRDVEREESVCMDESRVYK